MKNADRLYFLDNLRTFLIFLVVLYHAGLVYESSGLTASFWIVDDPSTSKLPGLLNVIIDIFVMPALFFISGFFAPLSLEQKGPRRFLESKMRRLMLPWVIAVLTLMPLYKVIFLVSRGLPQERWTTYFHFSNGTLSMNWLWFLPVLFLFDVLYVALWKLRLPTHKLPFGFVVFASIFVSCSYAIVVSIVGWIGWTKTPLVDFQNERMLPYLLCFLLGALCCRRRAFDSDTRSLRLYIAVCATAWLPINMYVIILLNYIFHPGDFLLSGSGDLLALWFSFHVSLLALVYCALTTFRYFFNRQSRLSTVLGRLSYGVYIVHIPVLGLIAVALLGLDIPGLVKYPALAVATWVSSNLLVVVYKSALSGLATFPTRIQRTTT
jgi:fucose 4-O-acetylase-like acetyltransferase